LLRKKKRAADRQRTAETHAVTLRLTLCPTPRRNREWLRRALPSCVFRLRDPRSINAPKLTRDAHVTPECHHLHLLLQSTPPVQRRARPAPQARVLASPPLSPRHTPQDSTRYATRHACGVFSPVPAAHVSRGHHVPRGGAHGLTRAVSRGFAPVPRASLLKRLRPCRAGRPS